MKESLYFYLMKIQDLIQFLETLAPPSLQESYDNAGLLVGNGETKFTKAIVCLDAVEAVVDEAITKGANLIIAHHPIIFGGLKKLNGKNYVERTVIKAIQNNIAIYAIHTNLDNVLAGVNSKIGEKLGIQTPKILLPKLALLSKLVSYVPLANKDAVLQALFDAGAGDIGNYSEASFSTEGIGSFKGNDVSTPVIGQKGERTYVKEARIEVLVQNHLQSQVMKALFSNHPYEEVAYEWIPLGNTHQNVGSGMIGNLDKPMLIEDFFRMIQQNFKVPVIKHTPILNTTIQRIAWCGGAGSFLIGEAKKQGAHVFLTGDCKYHEFFDADNQLVIADLGHYESEQYTSELLIEKLNKNFSNFAFLLTEINTNPVNYFI